MMKNSFLTVFVVSLFIFFAVSVVVLALSTVTLVAPVDNEAITGTYLLNATSDGADNASFYYSNNISDPYQNFIGNNTSSGNEHTLSWNTTGIGEGIYHLTVNVSDSSTWLNDTNENVTVDNTAPKFPEFLITNNESISPNNTGGVTCNITDNYGLNIPSFIGILDDDLLQGEGQYLRFIYDYNYSINGSGSFNGTYQWDAMAFIMTNSTHQTGYIPVSEQNNGTWEDYYYVDGWFNNTTDEISCYAFFNNTNLSFSGICNPGTMDIPTDSTFKATNYNGTKGSGTSSTICEKVYCENSTNLTINSTNFALRSVVANDSNTFTIEAWAYDKANNDNATYIYNVLIDVTPLTASLLIPTNGTWINTDPNASLVTFKYKPVDNREFKNCSLWIGNYTNASWNLTNSSTNITNSTNNTLQANLTEEKIGYIWNIHCNDAALYEAWGNDNFTFGLDYTPPNLDLSGFECRDEDITDNSITLRWVHGDDAVSGRKYYLYKEDSFYSYPDPNNDYVLDVGLTSDTPYTYIMNMTDNAGNRDPSHLNHTIICRTKVASQPSAPPSSSAPISTAGSSSGFYISGVTTPLTINAGSTKTATFKIVNNYEFDIDNLVPKIEGIEAGWVSLDKTSITQLASLSHEIITATFTIPSGADQKNYTLVYRADGTSGTSLVPRTATYSGILTVIEPEVACTPSWECGDWGDCVDNTQTRTCLDTNNCGTTAGKPGESQTCGITGETIGEPGGGFVWDQTTIAAILFGAVLIAIAVAYFYKNRDAWTKFKKSLGKGFGKGGPSYRPRRI